MPNKGLVAFDEFVAGVLSKLTDPEQRRKAEESINALKQVGPVAQAFGDGVAGQSEIDRKLQTLTTQTEELSTRKDELDSRESGLTDWHGRLSTWHQENRDAIEEAKRLKAGGKPNGHGELKPGDPGYVAPQGSGLTEEQFGERMTGERAAFLGFQRDQNLITREHYQKFNEIVELEPLLKHPQIAQVGLIGVYELVHKDRLAKFATDAAAKREETIRADERQKVLAGQAQMPYPSPTGAGSGSPLDALTAGAKEPIVDAAVAHFNRLQAERDGQVIQK